MMLSLNISTKEKDILILNEQLTKYNIDKLGLKEHNVNIYVIEDLMFTAEEKDNVITLENINYICNTFKFSNTIELFCFIYAKLKNDYINILIKKF